MPKGEVVTTAIVHDALRQGKEIFVPYIYSRKVPGYPESRSAMNMLSLSSESDYEGLEPDNWGIPTVAGNSMTERSPILEGLGEVSHAASKEITNGERDSRSRRTEPTKLDLIVMPGVAFDRELGRLGHGKGFYDRFLKSYHDSKLSLFEEETRMPFLGAY